MSYKLDLHTHSTLSHDGGISEKDYRKLLDQKILDYIAITDHNEIDLAQSLHQKLGDRIIIGEEILTNQGEIIGLFLSKKIPPHLSPIETIKQIKNQHGLVYIPHPYETNRHGLTQTILDSIASDIDIIEVKNARSIHSHKSTILEFAQKYSIALAASSDAHSTHGIGTSYQTITSIPTAKNLKTVLESATLIQQTAPLLAFIAPKYNQFKKFVDKIRIY